MYYRSHICVLRVQLCAVEYHIVVHTEYSGCTNIYNPFHYRQTDVLHLYSYSRENFYSDNLRVRKCACTCGPRSERSIHTYQIHTHSIRRSSYKGHTLLYERTALPSHMRGSAQATYINACFEGQTS